MVVVVDDDDDDDDDGGGQHIIVLQINYILAPIYENDQTHKHYISYIIQFTCQKVQPS